MGKDIAIKICVMIMLSMVSYVVIAFIMYMMYIAVVTCIYGPDEFNYLVEVIKFPKGEMK